MAPGKLVSIAVCGICTSGIVRLSETKRSAVWWNPYLNLGCFEGEVLLKVTFLTVEGDYEERAALLLQTEESST